MVGLALSSVGLLVGGVDVVAIMMISVTEHTREIRLRKALGILTAVDIRTAWPTIPTSTPLSSIVAALGASAVAGILLGMLPAMRAAKLDPVVALRHE